MALSSLSLENENLVIVEFVILVILVWVHGGARTRFGGDPSFFVGLLVVVGLFLLHVLLFVVGVKASSACTVYARLGCGTLSGECR